MNHHKSVGEEYHFSLDDVDRFLFYTKISGYHFDMLRITGGEPLLWENLLEGLKRFKRSQLIGKITIVSNGLEVKEENRDKLVEVTKRAKVFISQYSGNEDNVQFAMDNFPSDKIRVSGVSYYCLPKVLMEDVLPTFCRCVGATIYKDGVSFCSPVRTMGFLNPVDKYGVGDELAASLCTRFRIGYMNHFDKLRKYNWSFCRQCVGNKRLRNFCHMDSPNRVVRRKAQKIDKEHNNVQSTETAE